MTVGIGTTRLFFFCGQYSNRFPPQLGNSRDFSRVASHFTSVTTCFSAMGEVAASAEAALSD